MVPRYGEDGVRVYDDDPDAFGGFNIPKDTLSVTRKNFLDKFFEDSLV